jgi:hypothetical protein
LWREPIGDANKFSLFVASEVARFSSISRRVIRCGVPLAEPFRRRRRLIETVSIAGLMPAHVRRSNLFDLEIPITVFSQPGMLAAHGPAENLERAVRDK